MKIIVDAFGGDNAPLEVLKGCRDAREEFGAEILLAGDEKRIRDCASEHEIDISGMEIIDAPDIMEMTDAPGEVLKSKKNSSMAVGLKALAEGRGEAFVSAGSTGAVVMGATFIVKRIKGIKRPAIGSVLPSNKDPFLLLDCGANSDCTAEHLRQFAQMGDIYMKKFLNLKSPSVALANIGTEDAKGDRLRHEAFELLKGESTINFIGNVEMRDVPYGCCDILVADGFTGNVILKLYEGVAGAMLANIKDIFKKNKFTMLSALMVRGGLMDLKTRMDYSEFGGAPLLGVNGTVIKAHGASDAKSIKNAIRQAKICTESDVVGTIEREVRGSADE